jgi:TolB-like protein
VPLRPLAGALALLLAAAARAAAPAPPRQKLAVLDVRPIGVDKARADLLSEVAVSEASRFRKLETIGESEVSAMLGAERQRQLLGCKEDAACMAEIGGALGADFMLVGSLGKLGSLHRLDLKLMDARRAKVLARFGETVEGKEERLIAVTQRGVRELLGPVAGEPAAAPAEPAAAAPQAAAPGPARKYRNLSVRSGGEVLVAGHKNWRRGCLPARPPGIRITRQPQGGTVEIRRGSFVIFGTWHPDADRSCDGKSVPGLGIYYRARPDFQGIDTFAYQLTLGRARQRTFDVEAMVRVEAP